MITHLPKAVVVLAFVWCFFLFLLLLLFSSVFFCFSPTYIILIYISLYGFSLFFLDFLRLSTSFDSPIEWQSPVDSDEEMTPRTRRLIRRKGKLHWARTPELELALASQSVASVDRLFRVGAAINVSLATMFSPTPRCEKPLPSRRSYPYPRRRSSLEWSISDLSPLLEASQQSDER
mmetsp:Transcript_6024/g.15298  ORF Transcript_6024/g.15298 Transcript_6024/m.15298 type:complete len:177 (-) Transcript_6024:549-1079(-)